jgi:hypothetical protein
MEQYYEKLKRVHFSRTRNRPSHVCRRYGIWNADAGDDRQTRFDDRDDSTNHSVHRPNKASTHGGARPSQTILDAHAQRFSQKDEARSKSQITFKGELLRRDSFFPTLIHVGMNELV